MNLTSLESWFCLAEMLLVKQLPQFEEKLLVPLLVFKKQRYTTLKHNGILG